MKLSKNMNKILSFAVVFCMVFSGLAILGPSINTIVPIAPDTANEASAGLDPGPCWGGQDGYWHRTGAERRGICVQKQARTGLMDSATVDLRAINCFGLVET